MLSGHTPYLDSLKAVLDTIRFNHETALYSVFFHKNPKTYYFLSR
jgi:hypothetical protein